MIRTMLKAALLAVLIAVSWILLAAFVEVWADHFLFVTFGIIIPGGLFLLAVIRARRA